MNRKGQTTNRWRMFALVISLSALVLVTLGAYAPGYAVAADISVSAADPEQVGTYCSEAVAEGDLDRDYGTFTSCWADFADQASVADPNVVALDRNYGTGAHWWRGYVDQVATVNPNSIELDRNYGTSAGVWTDF